MTILVTKKSCESPSKLQSLYNLNQGLKSRLRTFRTLHRLIVFDKQKSLLQSVTQCLVLTVCTVFLFLRIHFMLKLLVALIIDGIYAYIIFEAVEVIYEVG